MCVEDSVHPGLNPTLQILPEGFWMQHYQTMGTWDANNHLHIDESYISKQTSDRLPLIPPESLCSR